VPLLAKVVPLEMRY